MAQYSLKYGQSGQKSYIVLDTKTNKIVKQSDSKSEMIAKSQELNGYEPIDGNEQTYSRQLRY